MAVGESAAAPGWALPRTQHDALAGRFELVDPVAEDLLGKWEQIGQALCKRAAKREFALVAVLQRGISERLAGFWLLTADFLSEFRISGATNLATRPF